MRGTALLSLGLLFVSAPSLPTGAQEPKEKEADDPTPAPPPKHTTLARNPKPLSPQIRRALDFLAKQQQADGSWNGGPAAAFWERVGFGGREVANKKSSIDVANTSIAALALLRAGCTPKQGQYSGNLRKAVETIIKAVENSDKDSLGLATTRGTQMQRKIGDNVDTYLAAVTLATARGAMLDARGEARLTAALQKIVDKMERNQKEDGTWQGAGWAPVLSQAFASRALNMAKQAGMAVDSEKLEKTAQYARESFKHFIGAGVKERAFDLGNAGVDLYSAAAIISMMLDAVNTNRALGDSSKGLMRSPKATVREREAAKRQLARLDEHEKALREAIRVIAKKIQDGRFVNGFGADGGEEFISFAFIAEALLANQMKEFGEWDKSMANRLIASQNANGGWSGKHCISGETFCTATALLTLMTDRAHRPLGAQIASSAEPARPPATAGPAAPAPATPARGETARSDLPDPQRPPPANAITDAERLLRDLTDGDGDYAAALAKLRDSKGADYTDALARAAAKLSGDLQQEARDALARRLTRMKADTLRRMLHDDYAEIRRAAAFACAMKEEKAHVPDLIPLLGDADPVIVRAAHAALKSLTSQDFGPAEDATAADRAKAILAWKNWWARQGSR